MSEQIILVENIEDWKDYFPKLPIITAKEYLSKPEYTGRNLRLLNLCRSYDYLSIGYYCSLLAEARRHRILPSVRTLHDLSHTSIYNLDMEELAADAVQQALGKPRPGMYTTAFNMDIFFGMGVAKELQGVARQLFNVLPVPLLQVTLQLLDTWRITARQVIPLHTLSEQQEELFSAAVNNYLGRRWKQVRSRKHYRYDLAILHNPKEESPPSNPKALQHFVKAGRESGIHVELIESKDYGRLGEFDALFIRENTKVDHYTYQFAKKAENQGMVVIDDADSILKCNNKMYVDELLGSHRIRTLKTLIVEPENLELVEHEIAYPLVLKIPDAASAYGAYKVQSREELRALSSTLFRVSQLLLAQEFIHTDFDWRVGILNKTPLFVCQYMVIEQQGHLCYAQAYGGRNTQQHTAKTLRLHEAPEALVKTALKAANLIGNGFYGVDLKQTDKGIVVLAVNDNPQIQQGIEDAVLKEQLYQKIVDDLIWRLDRKRGK